MNRTNFPNQIAQSSEPDASHQDDHIAWFHPGQSRTIEIGSMKVTVRYVGRKGRRGRIAITAPAGAVFCEVTGQQAPFA
jgi:hypothetical protein